ncbi:putative phage tail protein [Linnemannia elongata]|nr:putative phage tail protein [Linnemannia elongata]
MSYPNSTYRYSVSIEGEEIAFSNVAGLEMSHETEEYNDGIGGQYQMPGATSAINITLKNGVFVGQSKLYDWLSSTSGNQVEMKNIYISLTNESGSEVLVTWIIMDAFPTKLTTSNLAADSNEVAIEELSLVARRLKVEFGGY